MAGSLLRARAFLILSTVAVLTSGWASASLASAPILKGAGLPWADPTHQGPLELLAGRIATSLAGRSVAVHCESPSSWQTLANELGFDSDIELGYVPVSYDPTGQIVFSDAFLVELSPDVCLRLQQFASVDPKPTTCTVVTTRRETVVVRRRVLVHERTRVGSHVTVRSAWRIRFVRRTVTTHVRSAPRPCFAHGVPVAGMTNGYWSRYADDASAILVLAHEAVHLTQYRAGLSVPAPGAAESEAQCLGMQWMPIVAVQLGDTPADGQAIAQYTYVDIYPSFRGTPYWSSDCAPGRALDRRASGQNIWP